VRWWRWWCYARWLLWYVTLARDAELFFSKCRQGKLFYDFFIPKKKNKKSKYYFS